MLKFASKSLLPMEKLPVDITPLALEEVRKIMATKGIPDDYRLRLGIKGGGCGGMGFLLGFDHRKDHDQVYQAEGLEILVDKRHLMYLIGLKLDFEESAEARGFAFIKPAA